MFRHTCGTAGGPFLWRTHHNNITVRAYLRVPNPTQIGVFRAVVLVLVALTGEVKGAGCVVCCLQDLGFNASNMEVKLLIEQQVPEIAQVWSGLCLCVQLASESGWLPGEAVSAACQGCRSSLELRVQGCDTVSLSRAVSAVQTLLA